MTRPTGRTALVRAQRWTRREALRLVRRGGWHGRTAVLLLVGSAVMRRRMRAFRMGFFLLQHVDDLCDGDLPSADPMAQVDAIIEEWRAPTRELRGSGVAAAAAVLREVLEADPSGRGADAVAAVERLMRTMRSDHVRRLEVQLWSADRIDAHLHATFTDSIDLMVITAGPGTARAAQLPALVDAMCWCSVVRDFRSDIEQGIVNVPADVFGDGGPDGYGDPERVAAWWHERRDAARSHIDAAHIEVAALAERDADAARAVRPFLPSLERWYRRTAALPTA